MIIVGNTEWSSTETNMKRPRYFLQIELEFLFLK